MTPNWTLLPGILARGYRVALVVYVLDEAERVV
jgi:hypothetical protein